MYIFNIFKKHETRGEYMFKNILITISAIAFVFNSIAFADIKFWTTETQPARMAKQEEMSKAVSYTHLTLPTTDYV